MVGVADIFLVSASSRCGQQGTLSEFSGRPEQKKGGPCLRDRPLLHVVSRRGATETARGNSLPSNRFPLLLEAARPTERHPGRRPALSTWACQMRAAVQNPTTSLVPFHITLKRLATAHCRLLC